jgi:hypothetical protein
MTMHGISQQKFNGVDDIMSLLSEAFLPDLAAISIMLAALRAIPIISIFFPRSSTFLRQNGGIIGVAAILIAWYFYLLFVERIRALSATGLCERLGVFSMGVDGIFLLCLSFWTVRDWICPDSFTIFACACFTLWFVLFSECTHSGP